ncbi:MAG: hypothetical protein V1857_05540 [archaeon]
MRLKRYRAGTFDKRVAYGQRSRKLLLVARGIIDGFSVQCRSEKKAENLARAFRIRASHIDIDITPGIKYGVQVRTKRSTVHVIRRAAT